MWNTLPTNQKEGIHAWQSISNDCKFPVLLHEAVQPLGQGDDDHLVSFELRPNSIL